VHAIPVQIVATLGATICQSADATAASAAAMKARMVRFVNDAARFRRDDFQNIFDRRASTWPEKKIFFFHG
jgi:hypothetical protein